MQPYPPEALTALPPPPETLHASTGTGAIFQALCIKCDEFHNLHVDLGAIRGVIPREEAAIGIREGSAKEIAILSRVGKPVCFQVLAFDHHGTAILSRRAAQEAAKDALLRALQPGDVIPAVVQSTADFGVFCDIGCGFAALMRIDRCCISRLRTTAERYRVGQPIYAAVLYTDRQAQQIHLTGRELLGTWEENAALFRAGQTVTGTVRSIMPYGLFIELTPNLSGLAEPLDGVNVGDAVSVYIRSIQPQRHKIKLTVLEILSQTRYPSELVFYKTSGSLERWEYYPGSTAVTLF